MTIESIRKRDAQLALLRALLPKLGPAELIHAKSVPWASATFAGERHEIEVELVGDDADGRGARLVAELPEAELATKDHFVAEISARVDGAKLTIEALTVAED